MGDDVYQDPSMAIATTKPDDPFNDDVYQDPTAAMATVKSDDPFGEDVYQDPATVESTKKPDDGFGKDSIYKDPTLTEKTNIPEEDPYEDLSSIQTAVKENKNNKTEQKETYHTDTLYSSSSISSVVSKQGTLTRWFSPSIGKRPCKPRGIVVCECRNLPVMKFKYHDHQILCLEISSTTSQHHEGNYDVMKC